ncbi:MAG: hypothetical protein PHD67_03805 [Oscillospiraceae bacterium]|nr:hypothetical protein [Oscillospiraceae bacterium]
MKNQRRTPCRVISMLLVALMLTVMLPTSALAATSVDLTFSAAPIIDGQNADEMFEDETQKFTYTSSLDMESAWESITTRECYIFSLIR